MLYFSILATTGATVLLLVTFLKLLVAILRGTLMPMQQLSAEEVAGLRLSRPGLAAVTRGGRGYAPLRGYCALAPGTYDCAHVGHQPVNGADVRGASRPTASGSLARAG